MTRSNQILLSVVALGAAIAAFYFLALSPKREEIAALDAKIAAEQAEVEQARLKLAGYEEAKASYKRNYATLARLGKAVPGDDDVRSLMIQLESTADRSGVAFDKIELGTGLAGNTRNTDAQPAEGQLASAPGAIPVSGGVLSAMPFSFSFSGSYFDLTSFFARLERFVSQKNERLDSTGRLLRLESITIAPSSVGFPDMQAQINAATYLVPPVQGVTAGATPDSGQVVGTTPSEPGTTPATTTAATTGASR